jgi:hypothetical protein
VTADPTTAEWALIVAITLARLLVPLLIPRCELIIVVALVLDAIDNSLLALFTDVDLGPDGPYQSVDKALDVYYLAIAYTAMLRNWTSQAALRIGRSLFYYRLVGVLAFELLNERAMLLVFPNTFEYFFIAYALVAVRWEPSKGPPRLWLWTAVVLWVGVKLPQEYWIHVAQRDFTDTVAEHPWFGVLCALGVLVLLALGQFVARPRLPAPDHAARFASGPLPARPPRPTHIAWRQAGEKSVLVGLIAIVFAEILPDVETSALEVAVAVGVIVLANTIITLRWLRLEFGALVATNLALIFLMSRFFTARENFPLGTALFFALLISLLLALYDRYKPIHEARASMGASTSP